MYKALIVFTALLGLFSFNSVAASDDGSSCKQKAELAEEANVRFIGASSCADVGSVFTGNDHCQVRKGPSSGCQIDNFGVPVGLGYYFTGCLAGTNCAESPQPLPPVDVPVPPVLPPVAVVPVTPEDLNNPTGNVYFTNIQTELGNQRILSQDVLDNVYKLFTATNSLSATMHSNIINAKHEILNSVGSRTYQLSNNVAALSSQLSYTQNNLLSTINNQADQAAQNEVFTTNKILDAIADKDDLLNRLDGIDSEIAAVGNTLNYVALAEESSLLRDQEILQGVNQTRAIAANVNEITFGTRDSLSQLSGSVQALQNTVNSIADEIVPPPCGGLLNPPCTPGTGGSSVDLSETNNLLRSISSQTASGSSSIQSSIGTATNNVVGAIDNLSLSLNNLPTRADLENATSQISNSINGVQGTLNGNHSDRAGQLAYYHAQIMGALNSDPGGSGGGSTVDLTETNEKLDTTNYELSELRSLLDSRTQTSNDTLASIGSSVQSQGAQLTQISATLDGIGESIDGLSSTIDSSLKSDTAFTAPTVSDETIKASVGIDDTMDRESLFSEDVILSETSGTFSGWLGTSSCPNIPSFELPFGAQWKMDLTFFCDVLSIAGVLLMASAYISVPFIIFGGKK